MNYDGLIVTLNGEGTCFSNASVATAIEQIESTFDIVNQKIKVPASNYTGVIVFSAVPRWSTLKFQSLQDKLYRNKKLLVKRKSFVYEERI